MRQRKASTHSFRTNEVVWRSDDKQGSSLWLILKLQENLGHVVTWMQISIGVLKLFDVDVNLKSRRSLRKRLRFLRSWVLLAKRLVARKVHHATSFHPSDQV